MIGLLFIGVGPPMRTNDRIVIYRYGAADDYEEESHLECVRQPKLQRQLVEAVPLLDHECLFRVSSVHTCTFAHAFVHVCGCAVRACVRACARVRGYVSTCACVRVRMRGACASVRPGAAQHASASMPTSV